MPVAHTFTPITLFPMTSLNLTETEAAARSALIDVDHYNVTLDLTGSETHFTSRTVVAFRTTHTGSTFIDLRTDDVHQALLDGEELDVSDYDAEAGLALNDLAPGQHILMVTATIPYSRTGEGLHRFTDPADGKIYHYTQFETADAKRVFACFDQPDMKATYDLTVTTDPAWRVISNEPQTTVIEDGKAVHTSTIDYPLPTYLIGLCVGEYAEFTDLWRGELTHHDETPAEQPHQVEIPLGLYARASIAEHLDAERLFTETKQGFDFFHRNFGVRYPFTKYDQIFVPEFNAGAMENAGCVTIRDEYVFTSQATHYKYERRAETILHEMAHMWFGDLVTMRWWGDLWLNESFATWAAVISQAEETQYETAWVTFANVEKAWAYAQDQLPSTHPVSTDASDVETVEQNFDGITYAKGASVLKQLQAYVGRENFFAGVRRHFVNHAWSNATFDDLLGALEHSSGRDLSWWADEWLKTTGVNHLSADVTVEDGKYTSFAVAQTGETLRTHRIAVGLYSLIDGQVTRTRQLELDIAGASTPAPELTGAEAADLVLVNDDDLTYAIQDFDQASMDFLLANIDKIADPMARTLCWSAAWEATRSATLRARDFIALVARGAGAETELAVLERILGQAIQAQRDYADQDWAADSTALADALLAGARESSPETALGYEQALARVELTDDAANFFVGKLAQSDDAETRWRALTALVARGQRGEQDIAELLAEDQTASGAMSAVLARAALPDEQNKRAIVDELIAGDLSNLAARHKLAGLTYAGAAPLLQQFTATFYDVALDIWERQSTEMALNTLTGIYPSWDVTEEGVARAEKFLARTDLPAGLRRLTSESQDRQRRALRLRRVDAAE